MIFAQAQEIAKELSENGWLLKLSPQSDHSDDGYEWTWLHKPTGWMSEGTTSAHTKRGAFLIAIESAPHVL